MSMNSDDLREIFEHEKKHKKDSLKGPEQYTITDNPKWKTSCQDCSEEK